MRHFPVLSGCPRLHYPGGTDPKQARLLTGGEPVGFVERPPGRGMVPVRTFRRTSENQEQGCIRKDRDDPARLADRLLLRPARTPAPRRVPRRSLRSTDPDRRFGRGRRARLPGACRFGSGRIPLQRGVVDLSGVGIHPGSDDRQASLGRSPDGVRRPVAPMAISRGSSGRGQTGVECRRA